MLSYSQLQEQRLVDQYKKLPPELKELIDFGSVDVVIKNATREFALNEEQSVLLENEVMLVLLLMLPIDGFATRVREALEIEFHKAAELEVYVKENLFDLEAEIFELTEAEFIKKQKEETLQQKNTTLEPNIKNVHGYGAGLPTEEPAYSSKQEDVMSKPERNNPHTDENLPPWQK
ncbi:MAG: hypothetical protein R3B69_02580 [Candidatus Paceibacterota bacterium]